MAKLFATSTANRVVYDAVQIHGGNGYVREFPVEKLKRDVKITCIYEGTSEILQLTTFRERWQANINAEGKYYDKLAEELDALHAKGPSVGADAAAVAMRSLSQVLKACYDQKLTSNQLAHTKLGELMTYAETAGAFCRAAAKDEKPESVVFSHEAWRKMAKIHASHAAGYVSSEGLALVAGLGDASMLALDFKKVAAAQKGAYAEMDAVMTDLVAAFKEDVPA